MGRDGWGGWSSDTSNAPSLTRRSPPKRTLGKHHQGPRRVDHGQTGRLYLGRLARDRPTQRNVIAKPESSEFLPFMLRGKPLDPLDLLGGNRLFQVDLYTRIQLERITY